MKRSYRNRWISDEALRRLKEHAGSTVLDVGGGASPYARATHIVDIQPFSAERLQQNAWPEDEQPREWTEADYTELDILAEGRWPFETNQFDLGLSTHCMEDLRDPVHAVHELARVCRKVLIVCPSRLLEQTRGIDHPRYCGFYHHPWMVFTTGNRLVFRRKTPMLELPAAHLTCPIGKTLRTEDGVICVYGENIEAEELAFWSDEQELQDYAAYVEPYRQRRDLFVDDGKPHGLKFWAWKFRQKFLGHL